MVSHTYALAFRKSHPDNKASTTCSVQFLPKADIDKDKYKLLSNHEIHGFIGLIQMEELIFIGCITKFQKVASPRPRESVSKILNVEFFCLNDSHWDFTDLDSNGLPILINVPVEVIQHTTNTLKRHPCFDIKKILSNGMFYYSSNFDITNSLQDRGINAHSLSGDNFELEFMWNSFLMNEIIKYRERLDIDLRQLMDEEGFFTAVICGFAKTIVSNINTTKAAVTLISKLSWKRSGVRTSHRGINSDGNVTGFIETEFIMYSENYCFAFTQVRGSVPIFWDMEYSKLTGSKLLIQRSLDATQPMFEKHFLKLLNKYGPVNVINLLSTKNKNENNLSTRYREHLKSCKSFKLGKDVLLTDFDFNKETSSEGYYGVDNILPLIKSELREQSFFWFDVKRKRVISRQQGVFRSNCMDCLDRTNLVQQCICYYNFKLFLEQCNIWNEKTMKTHNHFINHINQLWADNSDHLAQISIGTNALKSSFIRKGRMSLSGVLSDYSKTVNRLYTDTFNVGSNERIVSQLEYLLGRNSHQALVDIYDPAGNYINDGLKKIEEKFISHQNVKVLIGTFNVNGSVSKEDISEWIYPQGKDVQPNIVVIGFQEVIELKAGSMLASDIDGKEAFWRKKIEDCLNQYGNKYAFLKSERLASILLVSFVRVDSAQYVKEVDGSNKKTGFGGIAGNKGGTAIRFQYGHTKFCFVNVHFAAGVNNLEDRRRDYGTIMQSITFEKNRKITDHDYIFWFGDMNYRVLLDNIEVRQELDKKPDGYLDDIFNFDQLVHELNAGLILDGFKEPRITFRPTYKYDNGTENYDTSDKARTPSWTDRILYKGNATPYYYSDCKVLTSDHRPVCAIYGAPIKVIDKEIQLHLKKKLYEEYKLLNDIKPPSQILEDFENSLKSKTHEHLDKEDKHSKPELPRRPNNENENGKLSSPVRIKNEMKPKLPKRPSISDLDNNFSRILFPTEKSAVTVNNAAIAYEPLSVPSTPPRSMSSMGFTRLDQQVYPKSRRSRSASNPLDRMSNTQVGKTENNSRFHFRKRAATVTVSDLPSPLNIHKSNNKKIRDLENISRGSLESRRSVKSSLSIKSSAIPSDYQNENNIYHHHHHHHHHSHKEQQINKSQQKLRHVRSLESYRESPQDIFGSTQSSSPKHRDTLHSHNGLSTISSHSLHPHNIFTTSNKTSRSASMDKSSSINFLHHHKSESQPHSRSSSNNQNKFEKTSNKSTSHSPKNSTELSTSKSSKEIHQRRYSRSILHDTIFAKSETSIHNKLEETKDLLEIRKLRKAFTKPASQLNLTKNHDFFL